MMETREVAMLTRDDGEVIELAGAADLDDGRNVTHLYERSGTWFARGGFALLDFEPVNNKGSVLHEGSELSTGRRAWRMRTVKQTYHREPLLEAAIRDAPDDEGRWNVYLDWLREHDDLLLRERAPDHAAGAWLQVLEKKHGFALHARIRGGFGALPVDLEQALRSVAGLPRMRFLRRLDVQPLSWSHTQDVDAALDRVVFPGLRALELGPYWEPQLPAVRARPHLTVLGYARAWLELGRTEQPIASQNEWGIERDRGCWRCSLPGVKVNGLRVNGSAPLRDGDRLLVDRGRAATFRAA